MTQLISLDQILAVLPKIDLIPAIERVFVAYSEGRAVAPPVGELLLEKGEAHIKYGYLKDDSYYVIKIASGFYENPQLGLPSSNGLMLIFDQQSGEPVAILLDEGHLTDVRTAVAGAIAAKYLAPRQVERIGIVGTGIQARLQLLHLQTVSDCRDVLVWGRGQRQLNRYQIAMAERGFSVETTENLADILATCNLVVTTTPSNTPLLKFENLKSGTHITAVGSDTPHKQELDSQILARADVVVADSIPQCLGRCEIHQALKAGLIEQEQLLELAGAIAGHSPGRIADKQITIADLTGVAVQDIKIAGAVYEAIQTA